MRTGNLTNHVIAGYQLHELLGEGAIGSVYHGYNPHLSRHAAVKVLTNPASSPQSNDPQRFMREARTIANLQHPHIIQVYDYGTDNGLHFIIMPLLTGGTLQDRLQATLNSGTLPSAGEVSTLIHQLASALDYAHRNRIIHRDIKPTNVMFDEGGLAYLVDFGIVKLTDETTWLTNQDMLLGTPAYMAPEQWRGEMIVPATDQYSLGVLAYELLTGQLPFNARTQHAMMYKHLSDLPQPVTERRPDLPPDVNDVLLKALAKTPEDRFLTASAFASAFAQAVQGAEGVPTIFSIYQPQLAAQPVPVPASNPRRQTTQNAEIVKPLMLGMGIGAVFLTLCTMGILFTGLTVFGENEEDTPVAVEPTDLPPLIPVITEEPTIFMTDLPIVIPATNTSIPPFVGDVNPNQLATINTDDGSVRAVAFHPGGALFASGGSGSVIQVWDGNSEVMRLNGHTGVVYDLAYSPDGNILASAGADGTVRLWSNGQNIQTLTGHVGDVRRVAFNPAGNLLLSTGQDKTARLWDVASGTQLTVLEANDERVIGAAFSPDGATFATGWNNNRIAIWDTATYTRRATLNGHLQEIRAIAFSPTETVLASSSSDDTVRIWNLDTGETRFVLTQHGRDVFDVAFSPDGSILASAGADNTVYLWNVATGEQIGRLDGHFGWAFNVDFAPDGSRLVSAGGDGTVRVWDIAGQ